jgi:hypothetical protein
MSEEPNCAMQASRRVQVGWLVANTLGAAAFLFTASEAWIGPDTEPLGEPFVWAIKALPLLAIFLVLHFGVGGMVIARRRRDWVAPLISTILLWMAAILFDNVHHGI